MLRLILVCLTILLIGLASCTKTETPKPSDPPPPVVDTIMTEQILTRKWEATEVSVFIYHGDTLKSTSEWIKGVGFIGNGQQMQGWGPSNNSYITFSSDHTYTHQTPDGEPNSYMLDGVFPASGSWNLISPKIIELPTMRDTVPTMERWKVTYKDSVFVTSIILPDPSLSPLDTIVAYILYELPTE